MRIIMGAWIAYSCTKQPLFIIDIQSRGIFLLDTNSQSFIGCTAFLEFINFALNPRIRVKIVFRVLGSQTYKVSNRLILFSGVHTFSGNLISP